MFVFGAPQLNILHEKHDLATLKLFKHLYAIYICVCITAV